MLVMVTGATGFVGRHVIKQLLKKEHDIIAVARNANRARDFTWFDSVDFIPCDLHTEFKNFFTTRRIPDVLVHLAWPGLPNYNQYFHISKNLTADLFLLRNAVERGLKHLIVTGTCLEYGMQSGPLSEEMETRPITPYGFAKDTLRKSLQYLQKEYSFTLQWLRLFYLFGEGQNKNSLLAQLDRNIDEAKTIFNMSNGDQLRDYLPIQKAAENIAKVIEHPQCQGVINCCSGNPIAVIDLVRQHCRSRKSNIKLNRGYYPYPDYEPLAFWGIPSKLSKILTDDK